MTVIRILLIAGLVYVALQQKKESTRNKILVVTGLLAFCMMGKEGLTQIAGSAAVPESCTATDPTDTALDPTCRGTVMSGAQSEAAAQTLCEAAGACTYAADAAAGGVRAASAPGLPRLTEMKELFPAVPGNADSVLCDTGTIIRADGTCMAAGAAAPTVAETAAANKLMLENLCKDENWFWEDYNPTTKKCHKK
jgi:hypothetical protein